MEAFCQTATELKSRLTEFLAHASKKKVLIVEDDKTLQETLAFNLDREGYEVLRASDGVSALLQN